MKTLGVILFYVGLASFLAGPAMPSDLPTETRIGLSLEIVGGVFLVFGVMREWLS